MEWVNLPQMTIISTTVGQESLRKNGVAIMVNKSPKCSTWMQSQIRQNDLCSFPRQTIQYHGTQAYAPTSNAEEAEVERFYEPPRPFRINTKQRCPFHYRGLKCKSRSQETPEITGKFGLGVWNEAGQRLIEFCQENTLVIANTLFLQHKRRLYTWTSPDGK